MYAWTSTAERRPYLELLQTSDSTSCSKCLGLGIIRLMHRTLATDEIDACPTCHGTGAVSKRNGYADPAPVSLTGR